MDSIVYQKMVNKEVITNPIEYVSKCERAYSASLQQIMREIIARPGDNKIILLSGPSSSGKTTGANMLARLFQKEGCDANVISLDDFYRNRDDIEPGPDGQRDFEVVSALDLELIQKTLRELIENGETMLPYFDFGSGKRTDNVFKLHLDKGDVVIIEGLHAINPIFTEGIDSDCILRIYASTRSDILDEDGSVLFGRRDVRFLRRTIRDNNFRNAPVDLTFSMWNKVLEGEDKYLVPLIDLADYQINSLHPYEMCIYKDILLKLFADVAPDSEYYKYAEELKKRLEKVTSLGKDIIPKSSLLREFVG
ncbi:MAG: nucleoside kinase [Clostridia bacterium]|jgi:uridine kinase|nr:nucleoside kinase [Clostridia bacterium]MBQ1895362.1 nucleoside kinase [Clostridia bacterium]MBQ6753278.1 nucleoside kinase [Clostridia bacterium]